MTAPAFSQPATRQGATPTALEITRVVRQADAAAPRSQQKTIGPSSLGTPCVRRLAYELFDMPAANTSADPWPAIVGTATHAWLAAAFTADNQRLGRTRWLVEQKIAVTDLIVGTADLYDTDQHQVIDHKVVGATAMRGYRNNGPGAAYRTQVHLYGYGMARAGHDVQTVAIAFYPRAGMLDGLHVWSEPYDQAVAVAALDRLATVTALAGVLDFDNNPAALLTELPVADAHCTYCDWYKPGSTDLAAGCPGVQPPRP